MKYPGISNLSTLISVRRTLKIQCGRAFEPAAEMSRGFISIYENYNLCVIVKDKLSLTITDKGFILKMQKVLELLIINFWVER